MIINMNGGTSGLSSNSAVLHVIAILGSTVSLFKNNILVKRIEPEKSHPDINNAGVSNYYFSISPTNYGEYRVVAEKDGMNPYQNITIDSNKQYNIQFLPSVYLIRNGVPSAQLELGTGGSVVERSDCYHLIGEYNESTFITQHIGSNLNYLNCLTLELIPSEEGQYGFSWKGVGVPELGYCLNRPVVNEEDDGIYDVVESVALNESISLITRNSFVLNMRQRHDSKYVFVSVASPGSQRVGYLNISNLYLSFNPDF